MAILNAEIRDCAEFGRARQHLLSHKYESSGRVTQSADMASKPAASAVPSHAARVAAGAAKEGRVVKASADPCKPYCHI